MSSPVRNEDVSMKEPIPPSRVLGVFGMSIYTRRDDLEKLFSEYGTIEKVELIYNRHTGRSKGFGFVYFERQEDAEIARLKTNGLELNERNIRVDFSRTESAHNPTPGFYNGKPIEDFRREHQRHRDGRDRGRRFGDRYERNEDRHYAPRRRSQSRDRRYERDSRDSRDTRDTRDSRETRDYRDTRDSRDSRDSRDYRDTRDSRDNRDYRRRSPSPRN